jgi:hypothetical protein
MHQIRFVCEREDLSDNNQKLSSKQRRSSITGKDGQGGGII